MCCQHITQKIFTKFGVSSSPPPSTPPLSPYPSGCIPQSGHSGTRRQRIDNREMELYRRRLSLRSGPYGQAHPCESEQRWISQWRLSKMSLSFAPKDGLFGAPENIRRQEKKHQNVLQGCSSLTVTQIFFPSVSSHPSQTRKHRRLRWHRWIIRRPSWSAEQCKTKREMTPLRRQSFPDHSNGALSRRGEGTWTIWVWKTFAWRGVVSLWAVLPGRPSEFGGRTSRAKGGSNVRGLWAGGVWWCGLWGEPTTSSWPSLLHNLPAATRMSEGGKEKGRGRSPHIKACARGEGNEAAQKNIIGISLLPNGRNTKNRGIVEWKKVQCVQPQSNEK